MQKTNLQLLGDKGVGRITWKIGIDIYTLLCMKQITNMDLLYSTGNFAQYFAMDYMEKNIEKWINVYA